MNYYIERYLPPKEYEKKTYGEVFTPLSLVKEMLDAIDRYDDDFWSNPNMKILDPAAGIGNFPWIAYQKLMTGLKNKIPDEEERRRHILEDMLYMIELNQNNVRIMKKIFGASRYRLNIHCGDALQKQEGKYDLIMGNPPFQKLLSSTVKKTIWHLFVLSALKQIKENGYLVFVHPPGWRNIDGKYKVLQNEMKQKNLLYLEIHGYKDGNRLFKCTTMYDWYVLKNNNQYITTDILFEDMDKKTIDIRNIKFIPNAKIDLIMSLMATDDNRCETLYSRSEYGIDKPWMSKTKDDIYKYPCIYIINSKEQITYYYSSKKDMIFDIPKLIWSNGSIPGSVIDIDGQYGLTEFAYAIVDEPINLPLIKKVFDSEEFRKLMIYCIVGYKSINYRVISKFKKDFWREFLSTAP